MLRLFIQKQLLKQNSIKNKSISNSSVKTIITNTDNLNKKRKSEIIFENPDKKKYCKIGSVKSLNRENDLFFTNQNVSIECIERLKSLFPKFKKSVWLEPSVGNGSFVNAILKTIPSRSIYKILTIDINSYDLSTIETTEKKKKKLFFLKTDFIQSFSLMKELSSFNSIDKNKKIDKKQFKNKLKRINVVGNPPFGKNASKAVKFFNQAAMFARIIAFIVPRSFEKDSIMNRLNRDFHLIHISQLPKNSFSFENQIVDVPCSFCVWVHRKYKPHSKKWNFEYKKRKTIVNNNHNQKQFDRNIFLFQNSAKNASFMIQRVGNSAGRVKWSLEEMQKKTDSKNFYFIQIKEQQLTIAQLKDLEERFTMEHCEEKYKTAGMPSITKHEILSALYQFIN